MKIAFLNSPFERTVDRRQRCTGNVPDGWAHPPIAFAYIGSFLTKNNALQTGSMKIFDSSGLVISVDDTLASLEGFKPDVIIVNVGIYTYKNDFAFIEKVKATVRSQIMVFGEFVTSFPEKLMEDYGFLDIVISGEPEQAISGYIDFLDKKINIEEVPSICYRKDGRINLNERKAIENLDSMPFPDRELIDNNVYKCMPFFSEPYTDLVTSRGCPFNCIFCTSQGFWGNYRTRSAVNIMEEVREVISKYGIKNFFLTDEIFGENKDVHELLEGFRQAGIKFAIETRVDTVNEELVKAMGESGCVYIHYGTESGSQRMLDYYRKGITVSGIRNAVRWSKEAGIETCGTFIIGNPEETEEDIDLTIDLASELKLDFVHFGPMMPFPLSDAYKSCKDEGVLKHEQWELYTKPHIVFNPKYLTEEQIHKLIEKAYKKTNFTLDYMYRRLRKIIVSGDLKMLKEYMVAALWLVRTFVKKKFIKRQTP